MRKYLTSLLILASSLLLPDEIFADEQVRKVQEELRKRHLFYANANGEHSRALTAAIKRYQEKKGFAPTGVIDSVTLASLGIPSATPFAATTPVVVGRRGQVHGANGEKLPSYPPFLWPPERVSKFDPAFSDQYHIELALENFGRHGLRQWRASGKCVRQMSPKDERSAPLRFAVDLPSEPIRSALADPVWNSLVLPPPAEGLGELELADGDRPPQVALRPTRRPQRRPRSVRPRKETNPIVLTYRSMDRAIRSLFGDTPTKKKRSTGKRL